MTEWIFVSYRKNNPREDLDAALTKASTREYFQYAIYGKEKTKTGKTHWQGYIQFKKTVTKKTVQKCIDDKVAHVEIAVGGLHSNQVYSSKDGDVREWGKPCKKSQGARVDLDIIRSTVLETGQVAPLVHSGFIRNNQHLKFAEGLTKYYQPKARDRLPFVIYLWGTTGTGKSHFAYEFDQNAFWIEPEMQWFDGYMGQKTAVFDEFEQQMGYGTIKRMLDRYPLRAKAKGTFVVWEPKVIIITSARAPTDWYRSENANGNGQAQFLRRINLILNTNSPDFAMTEMEEYRNMVETYYGN